MTDRRLIIVAFVLVLVASVGAALWSADRASDATRKSTIVTASLLRDSQIAGCHRGREDRQDAVRGWTAAWTARMGLARDKAAPQEQRLAAAEAAGIYRQVIMGYRSRIVDCEQAFPAVRP